MEIQLYKALTAAGIDDKTAMDLTQAMEHDIRERINDARKELASKADIEILRRELAESKSEIIKWNLGTLIAIAAIAMTAARLFH